jgi:hypothetical protein
VATTTEVIGEWFEGSGGRVRKREIVVRNTKAGDITLIIKIGRKVEPIAVAKKNLQSLSVYILKTRVL